MIHGKAAKMLGGIKAPRDATFDGITLGALVGKMAAEHGYIAAVAPDLRMSLARAGWRRRRPNA